MNIREEFVKRGYAPGDYFVTCKSCGQPFTGDKRASTCFSCAAEQIGNVPKADSVQPQLYEGWRDASKELPDSERTVQVYTERGDILTCNYEGAKDWLLYIPGVALFFQPNICDKDMIVAWRELPTPPAFV